MDEDEIAARLHGIYTSESESSDNSDSDDELLNALRPPPIPVELQPEDVVTVKAFKTVCYKKYKIKIPDVSNKSTNSSSVNKSERKKKAKAARNKKNVNRKNTKAIATTTPQNVKPQLSPIDNENSYADIVKLKIKDTPEMQKNDLVKSSVDCKTPEKKRAARKKENVDKSNTATQYQTNKPKTSDLTSSVSSGSNLDLSNKSKLEKKGVHFHDNKNSLEKDVLPSTSKKNSEISNVNPEEDRKTNIKEQKKVTVALDSRILSRYQRKRIAKKKRALQECDILVQEASNSNVNEEKMLQNKKKPVPSENKMHISGNHNSIEIKTRNAKKGISTPNDVLSSSNNPKNDTKEMELQNKRTTIVREGKVHVRQERKKRVCDVSTRTEIAPSVSSTSTQSVVKNNLLLSDSQILKDVASDDVSNQKNGSTRNKKKKRKKTSESALYGSNLQENVMSTDIKNHNYSDNEKKNKKQSNSKSKTVHLQEKTTSFAHVTEKQQEKVSPSSINHKNHTNGSMIIEKIQEEEPNSSVQSTSALSSLSYQLQTNRFINGNKLSSFSNLNHGLNDFGNLLQHDFDWFLKNVTADMLLRISNDMESSIK